MPLFSKKIWKRDDVTETNIQPNVNNNNNFVNNLSENDVTCGSNNRTIKRNSNLSSFKNSNKNNVNNEVNNYNSSATSVVGDVSMAEQTQKPKLIFHCQQAQGSPTGLISGFTNVRELYQKISECYDFPPDDILYCTLNTHKVDMTKLLGGQIGLEDFIFIHRKGRPKEIDITKDEDALGLTITDNGNGYAFIKRIKEGSIIDNIEYVQVGDHIEKINDVNLIGRRHFEVAKFLKDIPRGTTFTIRLIEPLRAGFSNIEARSSPRKGKKPGYGTGRETLRFKANGKCQIEEEASGVKQVGIENINQLLENFMGINDTELATQIWEQSDGKTNSMDFAEAIDNSDLEEFGFTDDFIIEIWGVITDARSGRIQNSGN